MDLNREKMTVKNIVGRGKNFNTSKLAISLYKNKITEIIRRDSIFIIVANTGSGKTTQLPLWIYRILSKDQNGKKPLMIGVTQPRRVAAISIATRVSQEIGTELGKLVGYSVRFEELTSAATRIKFMTDGMLLRESLSDASFKNYSCIILDEAHERSIQTDILFAIVKSAYILRQNSDLPPLKVVIMSATMNVQKFSNYFNRAPVYFIPGRQFPIKTLYAAEEQSDYVHSILVTVFQVHRNEPSGDILVFCTGQDEIEQLVMMTRDTCNLLPEGQRNILALPLYAALPFNLQFRIFSPCPNKRKVIFATNIAETSITIPGIKYVIDCGKVKCRAFKATSSMDVLKVMNISKAQAAQRAGRAGRESSGTCYRLYPYTFYQAMFDFTVPEIQRCNLASVLLQLAALGISNFRNFDFMDKPSLENIMRSTDLLVSLNALTHINETEYKITELGAKMVKFPLDPKLSAALVASSDLGCSEEILSIISLLSVESLFHIPSNKRQIASEVHRKFKSVEGDHIMLLKLYRAYKTAKGNKEWSKENFVDWRTMQTVIDIRHQLAAIYENNDFKLASCQSETEPIRKALAIGLARNVAVFHKDGSYKTKLTDEKVFIHPSSCLFQTKPEYVVYSELVLTSKCYMRNVSMVNYSWIKDCMSKSTIENGHQTKRLRIL